MQQPAPHRTGAIALNTERLVGHRLETVCRVIALFGGMVLLILVTLTVVSITGRALIFVGLGPVPGAFELVEHGTAFATFCFLPWCQIQRGHVTVDILAKAFGPRLDNWLTAFGNLLMTALAVLIAWRLWFGMIDKFKYNETSYILQFPVWWGYAACVPAAILFAVVSAYTVWRSANDALTFADWMSTGAKP